MTWLALPSFEPELLFWWPAAGCAALMLIAATAARPDIVLAGLSVKEPKRFFFCLFVGVGAGVVLTAVSHLGWSLLVLVFPSLAGDAQQLYARLYSGPGPVGAWPAFVTIIVVEEIVWRGFVQGVIEERTRGRRWPWLAPILWTSVIYGLATGAQLNLMLAIVALTVGAVWSALRAYTKELWAPIACHLVWDFGVMVLFPLIALQS